MDFFSFSHRKKVYPCALMHWFSTFGLKPDPDTGMWVVVPDYNYGVRPPLWAFLGSLNFDYAFPMFPNVPLISVPSRLLPVILQLF